MTQVISVLLNLVLMLLIVVSITRWALLLWQHRGMTGTGLLDSLLPPRVRRRPFWTPADALLMLGAMILFTLGSRIVMIRLGWTPQMDSSDENLELTVSGLIAMVIASSLGGLAAVITTLAWLRIFDHDARRQIGLRFSAADLKLGLEGALMILPPVMLISAATTYFVPYEHPVLQSLEKIATPTVFIVTFIGTAIVTPLVEEFLVRGLLQGSLQGIADRNPEIDEPWYSQTLSNLLVRDEAPWQPRSFWPVVVSSLIFAGLHIGGQGAAAIPLFFFSLGLGMLYRQTGSLTPPIVVHMVLNALTLFVEYMRLITA